MEREAHGVAQVKLESQEDVGAWWGGAIREHGRGDRQDSSRHKEGVRAWGAAEVGEVRW